MEEKSVALSGKKINHVGAGGFICLEVFWNVLRSYVSFVLVIYQFEEIYQIEVIILGEFFPFILKILLSDHNLLQESNDIMIYVFTRAIPLIASIIPLIFCLIPLITLLVSFIRWLIVFLGTVLH